MLENVSFQRNLPCSWSSYFVHTTRDCLTYDMTNYLKAMKNSLKEIINDIMFDLQRASH